MNFIDEISHRFANGGFLADLLKLIPRALPKYF